MYTVLSDANDGSTLQTFPELVNYISERARIRQEFRKKNVKSEFTINN
jgi:hypothetical protein